MKNLNLFLNLGYFCLVLIFVLSCEPEPLVERTVCEKKEVSFSLHIQPIIEQNCYNTCHNGDEPLAGFVLESYDDIKKKVNEERFLGSVQQVDGFVPMPLRGIRLSNCNLDQIKAWIEQGALEN